MEQILAFVLGAGIALIIWGVVVAFKTASKVTKHEKEIDGVASWLSRKDEEINRRIDQEIDRVNTLHMDSIRYTDSRVDKLEAKLTSIPKEILKG
jgi:hypothetical protein